MKAVLFIVMMMLSTVAPGKGEKSRELPQGNDTALHEYVKSVCQTIAGPHHRAKVLVVFVSFLRFGCVSCLNEFLDFCDTVKSHSGDTGSPLVLLLIKRDRQEEHNQYVQMKSWVHAAGIDQPFTLVPQRVFDEHGISNTALMILDSGYSFEYFAQFPLVPEKRNFILGKLFPGKR